MRRIDSYIVRELLFAMAATLVVLVLVSMGGLVADLLSKIARGKVPAALLLSQLGLRSIDALPLLLPLALFLGVLLAFGRLYRDSEMSVLAAAGLGAVRVARPMLWVVAPAAIVVAVCSMWLAPSALRASKAMIDAANQSLLVAGLEAGRFVEVPGRHSVVYVSEMDMAGSGFRRLFVHSSRDGRIDVVTAAEGEMYLESQGEERYLRLSDGFRVEGEPGRDDFRIMRFRRNDIRLPDTEPGSTGTSEQRESLPNLWRSREPPHRAELHWRLATPLAALLLALLALPLSRASPRSSRYGRLLIAVLAYILYFNLLTLGRNWLAAEALPMWLGLWWVHLPVLVAAVWMLRGDARLKAPRSARA